MALSDWSATASENATVLGVNIGEGTTAPSSVNNALRQICADLAGGINISTLGTFLASTSLSQARTALGVPEGSTSLTAFGNLTNTANSLPYMTGSDAWSTATLSSFGRTLIDDGDAATARATIEAVGFGTTSISATSGSIPLKFGATTFIFQWKDATAAANSSTVVTYPTAYTSWSRAWVSGTNASDSNNNDPNVVSTSTTGATIYSSRDSSKSVTVFSIGV